VSSAIGIITYRRLEPLRNLLDSIKQHCPGYPLAVFEDCATSDGTAAYLTAGAKSMGYDRELDSDHWVLPGVDVFLAHRNEGVAGGSNKAIKWFERGGWDHLCLCNDDLIALGDFPKVYAAAHEKLGVGLFTFCDLRDNGNAVYEGPIVPVKGMKVKILPRMTGMMMSMTKQLVQAVGYFDASFGRFGEEHSDFNNRARQMGFVSLSGKPHMCLDVVTNTLKSVSMEIPSSIADFERPTLDARASKDITRAIFRGMWEHPYRPYRLPHLRYTNAFGNPELGFNMLDLERLGYELLVDRSL
jgi:GT2 family glycosyltransferase